MMAESQMAEGELAESLLERKRAKHPKTLRVFTLIALSVAFLHVLFEMSSLFYYTWIIYSHGPYPRLNRGYQETGGELFMLLVFTVQSSLSIAVLTSLVQEERRILVGVLSGQYVLGWFHLLVLALMADTYFNGAAQDIMSHILFELANAIINWYTFAVVFSYFGWSERLRRTEKERRLDENKTWDV